MRFSSLVKGKRAERAATIRVGVADVPLRLRPLSAIEETDVIAAAIAHAKAKGAEPTAGHPIYEAAIMANTLAVACIDPDSDDGAFFDGGAAQVLSELDTDTIAQLYEQQQIWQEECSPSVRAKSFEELFGLAKKLSETDDPLAYVRLSPRTRWILQRTTGALLPTSPEPKPQPSSPSANGTAKTPKRKHAVR